MDRRTVCVYVCVYVEAYAAALVNRTFSIKPNPIVCACCRSIRPPQTIESPTSPTPTTTMAKLAVLMVMVWWGGCVFVGGSNENDANANDDGDGSSRVSV